MQIRYKVFQYGALRLTDGALIPKDESNRDYQEYLSWIKDGGKVEPEFAIDEIKTLKISQFNSQCAAQIATGFTSKALGSANLYPADATAQVNLQASVLASLIPDLASDWTTPFWCQDHSGTWAYRPHTAAQIQQVGIDGKDAINACIAHKIALEQQLAKAQTLADIEAIIWTPQL